MAKIMELRDIEVWDGNMAASQALRQAQIDVVAAYPITPSTPIVQNYGSFVSNGYVDGEFVMVESEHAAMSACVGAAAAGGRVATATSSQGFALMIEVLYQASGMRLPIVLNLVNRALAAPLNVNGDHSDMYLSRDTGWINLCTYNPQEAYDFNLMAFKIAEDKRVRVPIIVNQDGFICSHTAQSVRPFTDEEAYKFIGDYISHNPMLNFSNPVTYGAQTEEDWHFEHKAQLHKGIMDSAQVIEEVFEAFAKKSGRTYKLVETYDIEDAEVAIVALGTSVESARVAAKKARNEKGIKAGVISIRSLRPFPFKQIGEVLKGLKAVACIDRSLPAGTMGMLFNEFSAAALGAGAHLIMSNYIYGLGGRDLTQAHLESIFTELNENAKAGKLTHPLQQMLGLRGPKMSFFKENTMVKEVKNLKEFQKSSKKFEGAHLLCPGCAHGMIVREVLSAVDGPIIIGNSTGCLEVSSAVYPHTSWDVPWIHIGFENGSTAVAGAEAMYKALARKGRYTGERPKFVAFGGDGATYDIGFQWISGCFERGHDMTYICLDNEVYANTGGQRSGSTPLGSSTSTTPAGSVSYGKKERKKDLLFIMAAHHAPYVAQVAPNKWKDMNKKIKRAIDTEGPTFINAMSACTTEWRFESHKTVEISDLAVDSLVFPLFEIINGVEVHITYRPRNIVPVRDYLGAQGRFKHLFKPENEHIIAQFQKDVEARWEYLQRREEINPK